MYLTGLEVVCYGTNAEGGGFCPTRRKIDTHVTILFQKAEDMPLLRSAVERDGWTMLENGYTYCPEHCPLGQVDADKEKILSLMLEKTSDQESKVTYAAQQFLRATDRRRKSKHPVEGGYRGGLLRECFKYCSLMRKYHTAERAYEEAMRHHSSVLAESLYPDPQAKQARYAASARLKELVKDQPSHYWRSLKPRVLAAEKELFDIYPEFKRISTEFLAQG